MSIEENKAIIRKYMQAVVDGDIDYIEAIQHPDCQWWILGGGTMDKATFTDLVRSGILAANVRKTEILMLTAEEDRVSIVAEGEMQFDDHVYRNSYHNLLTLRDGLIVAGREYMDTLAVAEAFGK